MLKTTKNQKKKSLWIDKILRSELIVLILSRVCYLLLSLVWLKILTNYLNASSLSYYYIVTGWAIGIQSVLLSPIEAYRSKINALNKNKSTIFLDFRLEGILLVIGSIIILCETFLITFFNDDSLLIEILLFSVCLHLSNSTRSSYAILIGAEFPAIVATLELAVRCLLLFISFYIYEQHGYTIFLYSLSLCLVLPMLNIKFRNALSLSWIYTYNYSDLLRLYVNISVSAFLGWLQSLFIFRFLLILFAGLTIGGSIVASFGVGQAAAGAICTILVQYFHPKLYNKYKNFRKNCFAIAVMVLILLLCMFLFFSEFIVETLTNEEISKYHKFALPGVIFEFMMFFTGINNIFFILNQKTFHILLASIISLVTITIVFGSLYFIQELNEFNIVIAASVTPIVGLIYQNKVIRNDY